MNKVWELFVFGLRKGEQKIEVFGGTEKSNKKGRSVFPVLVIVGKSERVLVQLIRLNPIKGTNRCHSPRYSDEVRGL